MDIEREQALLHALRTDISLFAGAGFSVLALDRSGVALPTGRQLAVELRARFDVDPGGALDLSKLATIISATRRDEFRQCLTDRFSVASYDSRYESLSGLALTAIFTTNIDDLVSCIFQGDDRLFVNDLDRNGPLIHDRTALDYIALHGSVRNLDRPYRFNTAELASSFATDPDRWRFLRQKLNQSPTLFWGYSLEDIGTLEALDLPRDLADTEQAMWILLSPDADDAERSYFHAIGFAIISGDTSKMLDYVAEATARWAAEGNGIRATGSTDASPPALEQHRVPANSQVVLRPIEDFYAGFAPGWSDIYSRQLGRTSRYAKLDELARANSGVIIAGIPASGKSTLLMQLAAHMSHDGPRLILDAPNLAQIELVLRALAGRSALVCIDNCTADIDAFIKLANAPNVTLIGADRDYYLSIILHRVDLSRAEIAVHSVTSLSDQDLQNVWDSIPVNMRRSGPMVRPSMTGRVAPSLFEFLQTNVKMPRFAERLRDALQVLSQSDPEKAELLLLVAYVHSCRTPVSLDMLIGYLNLPHIDYGEVAQRLADIGDMLQEAADDYLDSEQDYYTTRSLLAGETIIDAAKPSELRQMLTRFHENLSALRVVNYSLFKRRALRANLFARAFPQAEDGIKIYDEQYLRDGSPYILQQKAHYLSHIRRHAAAFEAIEQATAQTHKNWTIRNSHAQILFRANIERVETPGSREQLDRAMATLTKCYQSDKRKAVHALTFGDFAIRYSQAFPDDQAVRYLRQGEAWLDETHAKEKWYARVPRVRAEVAARLREMDSVGAELQTVAGTGSV